jgi:predicted N-acetyltransferase YhbS
MTTDLSICNDAAFFIDDEAEADVSARETLLDRAMGPGRRRKSSEKLRRGRLPADGPRARNGQVIGSATVGLSRMGGTAPARPACRDHGIGSGLMR